MKKEFFCIYGHNISGYFFLVSAFGWCFFLAGGVLQLTMLWGGKFGARIMN